jgi:hypothetical protein
MSDERRSRRSQRGGLYATVMTVVVAAIVATAGSALYITAGGSLFGMGAGAFGLTAGAQTEATAATLQRAREAAWSSRHDAAIAAYDTVVAVRPGDRELALERARVLAWAERYSDAADALGTLPPAPADSTADDHGVQRARYLWWSGREREADSLLSVIRAAHPDLAEAAELQALIRPSVEPALAVAGRWVAEQPEDPWVNLWLARALVEDRRAAEALAHYRRALGEPGTLDPDVLLEAAGVALGADSLAFAGELLSLYLRDVNPPDWQTRLRLARAYSWGGRYGAAEAQYRIVLEQAPSPDVRLELARMLSSAGRHEAAALELAALLDQHESPTLLRELVRVLALAERYGDAADVLVPVLDHRPDDHEARLERARYLWWAGRLEAADDELTNLLVRAPGHAPALALRDQVRAGIDPTVERARQWLAMDDTRANRLHLARALVVAGDHAQALDHYDAALAPATERALVIEAADVADAAGAPERVLAILERHAAAVDRPAPDMMLRLARAHGWADHHDAAVRWYAAYLAERPADVTVRFERGRQLTWGDSAGYAEARRELERVVAADGTRAEALKLLGDLARWSGDATAALAYYLRAEALEPTLDSLQEAVQLAMALRDLQVTPRDATQVAWAVELDGFTDTEGFDWVGSAIRREWRFGQNALFVGLGHGYSRGRPAAGADLGALGLGATVAGQFALAPGLNARAEVGAMSYEGVDAIATWGGGLDYDAGGTSRGRLWYGRSPAVREAATMAALQAGAIMDRGQLTAGHDMGPWQAAGDLQFQRFAAEVGDASRYAGMVRVHRNLGESGLAVGGLVRGVFAARRSPYLAEWGRLYWTPDHYVAPALTISYGATIADGLWLGLRAAPGMAFIDESDEGLARYESGRTAILETGASLGYHRGPWRVEVSGDWGGAVPSGYNASSLRFQISRIGGRP